VHGKFSGVVAGPTRGSRWLAVQRSDWSEAEQRRGEAGSAETATRVRDGCAWDGMGFHRLGALFVGQLGDLGEACRRWEVRRGSRSRWRGCCARLKEVLPCGPGLSVTG